MHATALLLISVVACSSTPSPTSASSPPPSATAPKPTPCGAGTCSATEICVPGGTSQNGIGETVQLAPEHCTALPAACNGVATCKCVDELCPIGACASADGGRLVCVAG